MKREDVCNERMIEKDVTVGCLQRKDDREGCNGRMIVMEGCQRRMSWKEEVHSRQQKKEGGTLSQMIVTLGLIFIYYDLWRKLFS